MLGKFITLEGGEGAGKSTNLAFMAQYLRDHGVEVVTTREPGGTDLGEQIRTILLDPRHQNMTPECELLLVFAARAQHIAQTIKPALAAGKWVISDRFTDASYAYQGAAREMGFERVAEIEHWLQQGFAPHFTFVLDLPVDVGMQRVAERAGQSDRFEQQQQAFFQRVRQAYLRRANAHPARYQVIDASAPLSEVQTALGQALARLLA
jgi:dTMP kinase